MRYPKLLLCALLITIISACSTPINTHILANSIKADYQEQLEGNYAALQAFGVDLNSMDIDIKPQVTNVSVIHLEGNQYIGVAEINIAGFTYRQNLNIIVDGLNYYWEVSN